MLRSMSKEVSALRPLSSTRRFKRECRTEELQNSFEFFKVMFGDPPIEEAAVLSSLTRLASTYRRSGNFRGKNNSRFKFSH